MQLSSAGRTCASFQALGSLSQSAPSAPRPGRGFRAAQRSDRTCSAAPASLAASVDRRTGIASPGAPPSRIPRSSRRASLGSTPAPPGLLAAARSKPLQALRLRVCIRAPGWSGSSASSHSAVFARGPPGLPPSSLFDSPARAEEAEGILKPQNSEKLNFNSRCVQSPLLNRLWASAVLCVASDEVLMDEKTISPLLVLSEDKKTLTFSPGKARGNLDGPERFDHWPNGLAEESFCAGVHAWKISVAKSCAYKVGVAYPSVQRKGSGPQARLGCSLSSWVFSCYDKEFQFSHNNHHQAVHLLRCPLEIGVLVDLDAGQLLFYDPESCTILYTHHETFTEPVYPALAVADQSISLVSCD